MKIYHVTSNAGAIALVIASVTGKWTLFAIAIYAVLASIFGLLLERKEQARSEQ